MKKSKALWITRTAIFLALLVVTQILTTSLGSTMITGSIVNFILIVSVMTCGLGSGSIVALVSPLLAKFIGHGPLWEIIPFIMLGNLVLVFVWHFAGKLPMKNQIVNYVIGTVAGAVAKFAVLYITVVKIMVPLLGLPDNKAALISTSFSTVQLITALIGGLIAVLTLPLLKKVIK